MCLGGGEASDQLQTVLLSSMQTSDDRPKVMHCVSQEYKFSFDYDSHGVVGMNLNDEKVAPKKRRAQVRIVRRKQSRQHPCTCWIPGLALTNEQHDIKLRWSPQRWQDECQAAQP